MSSHKYTRACKRVNCVTSRRGDISARASLGTYVSYHNHAITTPATSFVNCTSTTTATKTVRAIDARSGAGTSATAT